MYGRHNRGLCDSFISAMGFCFMIVIFGRLAVNIFTIPVAAADNAHGIATPIELDARNKAFDKKIQENSSPVARWSGCLGDEPKKMLKEYSMFFHPKFAGTNINSVNRWAQNFRCLKNVVKELEELKTYGMGSQQLSGHIYTRCVRTFHEQLCSWTISQYRNPTGEGCQAKLDGLRREHRLCINGPEPINTLSTSNTENKCTKQMTTSNEKIIPLWVYLWCSVIMWCVLFK